MFATFQAMIGHSILVEEGGLMVILVTDAESAGLRVISCEQSVSGVRSRYTAHAGWQLRCETLSGPNRRMVLIPYKDFRNVWTLSGSPYRKMRPATAETSRERKIKSMRETVEVFCSAPGSDLK